MACASPKVIKTHFTAMIATTFLLEGSTYNSDISVLNLRRIRGHFVVIEVRDAHSHRQKFGAELW